MKRVGLSQFGAITFLLIAILIFCGFLNSQIIYNSVVNHANQDKITQLINQQGNISTSQRNAILREFEGVANGSGFATHDLQVGSHRLLLDINHTLSKLVNNSTN